MAGAECPDAVGEGLPVPADRFLALARHLIDAGEVVLAGEGIGVAGTQDPLAAGERMSDQGDRLVVSSRCRMGNGDVAASGDRVWMVRA